MMGHYVGIHEYALSVDLDSHLKSVLDDPSCWQEGQTFAGVDTDTRKVSVAAISGVERFKDLDSMIFKSVNECLKNYCSIYDQAFITQDEGYTLLKYKTGDYYRTHKDDGKDSRRVISCVIYLNDDYEGGELNFPYLNVKIKPKKNSVLVFPSNYIYAHESLPVLSGEKLAIVTWLNEQ